MKALISLAILSLIGNHSSYNGIEYRKLVWSDFRGSVPTDQSKLAEIFYNVRLDEMNWDGKVTFTVTPEFLESKSYTRTNDLNVLKHEQAHFDLCLIYSRLIETDLTPYQNCLPTRQYKAEKVYNDLCEKLRKMEELFDKETANSTNTITEAAWEKSISKEISTK